MAKKEYVSLESIRSLIDGTSFALLSSSETRDYLQKRLDRMQKETIHTGYWKPVRVYMDKRKEHMVYTCSECGKRSTTVRKDVEIYKDYPYCHCGCKMEESNAAL